MDEIPMKGIFFPGRWVFKWMILCLALSPHWGVAQTTDGQDLEERGFVVKLHRDEQGILHKYALFIPHGYSALRKWPAILYLHGAGECGTDGLKPTTMGIGPFVKQRESTFPFVVIFPQSEDTSGRILTRWNPENPDGKRALTILEEVQKQYSVDTEKVVLTGWSMGAYGTWDHFLNNPRRWSAVVPIAGGLTLPEQEYNLGPEVLKGSRVWAFHGSLDNFILKEESTLAVEALLKHGAEITYTELPNGDHGVWRQIYGSDEIYRWMAAPSSLPNVSAILSTPLSTAAPPSPFAHRHSNEPFIHAMYIPKAVTIRLGNSALAAVSDAVPGMVPRETLEGQLADMYDTTTASGRTFQVQMSGISYSTQLQRVLLKALDTGEISLKIGLKQINMLIGGTYITGGPRSASVGPIRIDVGTKEPVWLNLVVKPRIEAGKILFDLTQNEFHIQPDNWSYSQPGGIATRGLGMTQDRVYDGVMSGMASSKPRIESQVKSLVPSLIKQLEERIEYSQFDSLIAGMWPLPMEMPRVLTWADKIQVDGNGITLVLGATVGAITDEQKKAKPRWAKIKEKKAHDLSGERFLYVGVNPQILLPISEIAVEGGEARINVLDTPSHSLASLSDRKTMSELIPAIGELESDMELSTDLVLRKAVDFNYPERQSSETPPSGKESEKKSDRDANSNLKPESGTRLEVTVPELLVQVSVRPRHRMKKWEPFAELVLSMTQQADVYLERMDYRTRALQMSWRKDTDVQSKARFSNEQQSQNRMIEKEKWQEVVLTGWREFTGAGHAARMVIPDVEVGVARLRAFRLTDDGELLGVAFGAPALFISNRTETTLRYQTKILSSNWSTTYSLKGGDRVRFDVPTDMLIRLHQSDTRQVQFNLAAGSSNVYMSAKPGSAPTLYAETSQEQISLGEN